MTREEYFKKAHDLDIQFSLAQMKAGVDPTEGANNMLSNHACRLGNILGPLSYEDRVQAMSAITEMTLEYSVQMWGKERVDDIPESAKH